MAAGFAILANPSCAVAVSAGSAKCAVKKMAANRRDFDGGIDHVGRALSSL
jgi:hypothetical protein